MIDIHPPQHGAMTVRDFFVHLGIVVLGILIAIGLEQTVEFIHHRQQRAELNASLHADTQKTIQDTENIERFAGPMIQWLNGVVEQIDDAVDFHKPLAAAAPKPQGDFDAPDDPAWTAGPQ